MRDGQVPGGDMPFPMLIKWLSQEVSPQLMLTITMLSCLSGNREPLRVTEDGGSWGVLKGTKWRRDGKLD